MRLSVVMAVRNGEPYLREAIESVLAQSIADFEFLIVDDASSDGTDLVLSDYDRQDTRIRVWRNDTQLGPYPSVNRALRHARGGAIARHDADDVSPPERFAIQLEALSAFADVTLVTGAVDVFGETLQANTVDRPPSWQPRLEWELLFANAVGAGAHVMFPRVVSGSPVLFPAQHRYAEDYGLWCRLAQAGHVVCPVEIVYRYRQHGQSITSRAGHEQTECADLIRRAYQGQYLRSPKSAELSAELSHLWSAEGGGRLPAPVDDLYQMLAELRSGFLAYAEGRFGPSASATLAAEIDGALNERIGYWLYRSIRCFDWRGVRNWLALARSRRRAVGAIVTVLRTCAGAGLRKLEPSSQKRHDGA